MDDLGWCWVLGFRRVEMLPPDVKSKSLLFRGEMVRAILAGRKTQTRRPMKHPKGSEAYGAMETGDGGWSFLVAGDYGYSAPVQCPWGVGERLRLRETWAPHPDGDGVVYRATDPGWDDSGSGLKWKPSIRMPRRASRITLEVTSIRVERVRDISESDALAEGIQRIRLPLAGAFGAEVFAPEWPSPVVGDTARDGFFALWRSIHG